MFALHQVQPADWGWAGGRGAGERCKLGSRSRKALLYARCQVQRSSGEEGLRHSHAPMK